MSRNFCLLRVFWTAVRVKSLLLSSLAIQAVFLPLPSAFAANRYICSGVVQYTPCPAVPKAMPFVRGSSEKEHDPRAGYRPPKRVVGSPRQRSRSKTSAALRTVPITDQSFTRVSGSLGNWRGFVAGAGTVHVALRIYQNGSLTDTRYMGSVEREVDESPTRFTFRSPLPRGSNWSWKIIAWAT